LIRPAMAMVVYKPVGLLVSALGGFLAGKAFKSAWRQLAHEDSAPNATDPDRSWREVLVAAALQGAVFGLVKAAVNRAGAKGFERATGTWPE
jgi:Protein of unknown function (DUF4235)